MTSFDPIYRATVYSDEAMSTPLTPASGAPHSDAFQVATRTGVTGFQPYLGIPKGPRGEMDPLERTVSTGQLTLRLLDQRTTEGGSNLQRWVTAFVGDADGDPQLGGRLVVVEESTDGGSSWSDFFTGRIHRTSLQGRIEITLAVRDRSEDLDRTIFVGRPHASASGFMASLWPVGLTESYGALPTVDLMSGVFRSGSDQFTQHLEVDGGQDRNVITRDLHDRLIEAWESDQQFHPSLRIRTSTGDEYRLQLFKHEAHTLAYIDEVSGPDPRIHRIGIAELPADDPNHASLPADGATLSVEIIAQREPGEGSPILVDDVHPAQILKEVAQGYYGYLDQDGSPLEAFGVDTASVDTLIADTSFPDQRLVLTEPMPANEFIETLCRATGIGYRVDASGDLTFYDMRVPDSASATTIGNDALAQGQEINVGHDPIAGVTLIEVGHYETTAEEES